MGLLKLLGLEKDESSLEKENERLKSDKVKLADRVGEAERRARVFDHVASENSKLKADNVMLMGKVSSVQAQLATLSFELDRAKSDALGRASEICDLTDTVQSLKDKLSKRRKSKKK